MVLVTRDVTERPEAVAAGPVQVVGTKSESIIAAATRLLDDDELLEVTPRALRLRKGILNAKARKRAKQALES